MACRPNRVAPIPTRLMAEPCNGSRMLGQNPALKAKGKAPKACLPTCVSRCKHFQGWRFIPEAFECIGH